MSRTGHECLGQNETVSDFAPVGPLRRKALARAVRAPGAARCLLNSPPDRAPAWPGGIRLQSARSSIGKDARMKRSMVWCFLLVAVLAAPVAAHAHTSVGVSVSIGNAPPPPVVVFRQEPRLIVVPNSTVYVV